MINTRVYYEVYSDNDSFETVRLQTLDKTEAEEFMASIFDAFGEKLWMREVDKDNPVSMTPPVPAVPEVAVPVGG